MGENYNISFKGSGSLLLISLFLLFSVTLYAQADKKNIRKGNREYGNEKFSEAEILYRKAIDNNKQSPDAIFNIGDALYKQKKYEDAGKQFIENVNQNESREKKSAGLYNLGNSMLMANKLKESIDAYKGSLKLNPDSPEAKYNLAYAQDLLKEQEEQQKQQDKDKQDQNKDDNKNDPNKDKNDKDQQKEQDKKDDKQNDQNKDQQQQQQSVSKEDAQRLLNALANDEKNVQEKVKLAKAAKARVKTVKNW